MVEALKDLVAWMNANAGGLAVGFSGVVALSTLAYAALTWRLVSETVRMRRAETDPAIAAFLTPSDRWVNVFELVVRNQGRGLARNIKWSFEPSVEELSARGAQLEQLKFVKGLSQLAPGQELRTFLGTAPELLKEPQLPSFKLTTKYSSISGEARSSVFILDVAQFSGITRLGNPLPQEVVKELQGIKNSLNKIGSAIGRQKD